MGQGLQCLDEAVHDRPGLPVIVAKEDRKAAHALDKRRHIGFSELLTELNEIAFPMPELLSISNSLTFEKRDSFRNLARRSHAMSCAVTQ